MELFWNNGNFYLIFHHMLPSKQLMLQKLKISLSLHYSIGQFIILALRGMEWNSFEFQNINADFNNSLASLLVIFLN